MRLGVANARKVDTRTQGQHGPSAEEMKLTVSAPQLNLGDEKRGDRHVHHEADPDVTQHLMLRGSL